MGSIAPGLRTPGSGVRTGGTRLFTKEGLAGDLWGALAAMLVALPASIAFGVAVFAPLGPDSAPRGALAGMLGAIAIGLVAPLCGGTDRLISAPCAPAAAVMGAFALSMSSGATIPSSSERIVAWMVVLAILSATLQILYGIVGGGTLIKYIPYPVVTGYLSGVAVVIFLKQLPALLGLREAESLAAGLAAGLASPSIWEPPALLVGGATIAVTLLAPRWTRAVPAPILGLAAGVTTYFALALARPELLTLAGNRYVIGSLGTGAASFLSSFGERGSALLAIRASDLPRLLGPALTLSVLLSIDTLKTCVVVDALTRSRHDSNRELRGQGLANLVSAAVGGMPGAGTSGATLVNLASGGRTRRSSFFAGLAALAAFLLLGRFVAWAPHASLAGILAVVAWRMFDRRSFRLLRQRSTVLDFVVVASVIAVAVFVDLIAASATGVALAILLFIRDQIRGSVIRFKTTGGEVFSKQRRLAEERTILEQRGRETVVCELQGSLFFGTTDQLFSQLESDLESCRYLVLDLRLVRSVDLTAAHLLEQIEARLAERGAELVLSGVPKSLPTGQDLREYFAEVGVDRPARPLRIFNQLSDALEWIEDRLLEASGRARTGDESPLALREIEFLRGRREDTIQKLESCVEERSYLTGERIFQQGDRGDEIYLVRRGRVKIVLQLAPGREYHVATFARGDFFGDMAFLDRRARSADAVASAPTDLYVLSRERLDALAEEHPRLGRAFFAALAHALALRLRRADAEIRALEEA